MSITTVLLARSPASALASAQLLAELLSWKLQPPAEGSAPGLGAFGLHTLTAPNGSKLEILATQDVKWLWSDRQNRPPLALAVLGVGLGYEAAGAAGPALLGRRAGAATASRLLNRLGAAVMNMDFSAWRGVPIPRPAVVAAGHGSSSSSAAAADVTAAGSGGAFFAKKEVVLGTDMEALAASETALQAGAYARVPQSLCLWEARSSSAEGLKAGAGHSSAPQHHPWLRLIPGEYSSLVLHASPRRFGSDGAVTSPGRASEPSQDLPSELVDVLARFGGDTGSFEDAYPDEEHDEVALEECCNGACGRVDVASCPKRPENRPQAAAGGCGGSGSCSGGGACKSETTRSSVQKTPSTSPVASGLSASLYGVRRGDMSSAQVVVRAPELEGLDLRFCAAPRPALFYAEPPETMRDDVDPRLNDASAKEKAMSCRSVTGLQVASGLKKRLGVKF